jgi:hypothetical protein
MEMEAPEWKPQSDSRCGRSSHSTLGPSDCRYEIGVCRLREVLIKQPSCVGERPSVDGSRYRLIGGRRELISSEVHGRRRVGP